MQVENIKLFQRLTNIYFASLKLNISNHIVKVFGKIHSFIITGNPNGKQSISQITFQILVISVQLYDFSLACKSRYTIQENKSPVNR
jgi:hypothetical protein